jgi:catechol 2,3-dioxygenase-like lactoylglutathione lyase family enzyme
MLKYLESVGIQVSDHQRAIDFYVNQLGFDKINDGDMGNEFGIHTFVKPA